MKKAWLLMVSVMFALTAAGCSTAGAGNSKGKDTITIAWLPNESSDNSKEAREEIGALIEKATGKKVEHKTTTDYIIAVESIANGNADLAFLGAQSYIEAHNKNQKVMPLVVNSGKSGTLDDAVYYSWINVKKANADQYKSGGGYSLDNIAGKRFSFVSNSSTSGFKVPSKAIASYFSKKDPGKPVTAENLLEGGPGKFFSEVLYGGSHQGSVVNLLMDKADVAATCDTCMNNYVELADGTNNKPGAVYRVKQDAAEPFNNLHGQEFVAIYVAPVLNSPFAVNTDTVSEEDRKKLLAAFTADEVANNPKIFVPKDSKFHGIFEKAGNEKFVPVEDAWFNPVRELSN